LKGCTTATSNGKLAVYAGNVNTLGDIDIDIQLLEGYRV
jgi:hypothetical protein